MPLLSVAEFARRHMLPPAKPLRYSVPRGVGTDVYDALREMDAVPGDASNIQLLYSGYIIPPGARDAEFSAGWTREHVWPQSHAQMRTGVPGIATDLHNLFAADASVNNSRSDKDFDEVSLMSGGRRVTDASPAPGQSGELLARSNGTSWEPPDSCKGVVSRAALYMACMYADRGLRLIEGVSSPGSLYLGRRSALLRWNRRYPPDRREKMRNDVAERLQGNRNPFIDDQRLADLVAWDIF